MGFEDRYLQFQRPKYDCLLFDLDDTLYPQSSGIQAACDKNVKDYMVEKLGIDKSKVAELGNFLYTNYGTTMAGLRSIGYDFDYDDYHSFVHGRLPYEILEPDPVLRNLLLSLDIPKVIFTNADQLHAAKVLIKLGLEDCFERIICFETLNPTRKDDIFSGPTLDSAITCRTNNPRFKIFDIVGYFSHPSPKSVLPKPLIVCKPSESAIEQALKILNINPQRTMFFEDSVRNIQAGKRLGLHTVLVGNSQRVEGADFALESIHDIREAIPEIWEGTVGKSEAMPEI